MVEATLHGDRLYWREMLYQAGMSQEERIAAVKAIAGKHPVWCDSADPEKIKSFRRHGINAKASNKSVSEGIDHVKNYKLFMVANKATGEGENLIKEIDSYSYKRKRSDNKLLEEVVKSDDHLMDAGRYATFNEWGRPAKAIPGYAIPYEPFNAGATN
jgi:phage terminase large subunit